MTEEEKSNRAPEFIIRLKDTEILDGTFLRFVVKLKGDPKPVVKFYKDDMEIKDGDAHIQINRDKDYLGFYELAIPEVKQSDAGKYSCMATNKFGSADCEAQMTVCG